MKTPTNLEILNVIYNDYYEDYVKYSRNDGARSSKNYVPIDCNKIAKKWDVDVNIIFGRLYYHLDKIYGYENNDGSKVPFFSIKVGEDKHCINFPLLSSVLAGMRQENKKYLIVTWLSIIALIISAISIGITINNQITPKQINDKQAITKPLLIESNKKQ